MRSSVEYENSFITSGPDFVTCECTSGIGSFHTCTKSLLQTPILTYKAGLEVLRFRLSLHLHPYFVFASS